MLKSCSIYLLSIFVGDMPRDERPPTQEGIVVIYTGRGDDEQPMSIKMDVTSKLPDVLRKISQVYSPIKSKSFSGHIRLV